MRKIKNLLILVLAILFAGNVYAASATTSISGTNTVKVGNTTKIYIKLNASDLIEGVDVTYAASGNITVTNATIPKYIHPRAPPIPTKAIGIMVPKTSKNTLQ